LCIRPESGFGQPGCSLHSPSHAQSCAVARGRYRSLKGPIPQLPASGIKWNKQGSEQQQLGQVQGVWHRQASTKGPWGWNFKAQLGAVNRPTYAHAAARTAPSNYCVDQLWASLRVCGTGRQAPRAQGGGVSRCNLARTCARHARMQRREPHLEILPLTSSAPALCSPASLQT
jgi:hypothetical protein